MQKLNTFIIIIILCSTTLAQQAWQPVGQINGKLSSPDLITALHADVQGNIYAGLNANNDSLSIVKWNGNHWEDLKDTVVPTISKVRAICSDKFGNIYVGYDHNYKSISKFNGTTWNSLSNNGISYIPRISSLASDSYGNIYASALTSFTSNGSQFYLAKWNGNSWSKPAGTNALNQIIGSGSGVIRKIIIDNSDNIYVLFDYTIPKFNGSTWSELGGVNNLHSVIPTLNTIPDFCIDGVGNVYASVNSSSLKCIYKFNGTSWSQHGPTAPANTTVEKIGSLNDTGRILVSNPNSSSGVQVNNAIAVMDANSWTYIPDSLLNLGYAMCSDLQNNIYFSANMTGNMNYNSFVAKYDGNKVTAVRAKNSLCTTSQIQKLYNDNAGNIYGTGYLRNDSYRSYIAKWNGIRWIEMDSTTKSTMYPFIICSDNMGNVYSDGGYSGTYYNNRICKWTGSKWKHFNMPGDTTTPNNYVKSMYIDAAGNLYIAGDFTDGWYFNPIFNRYVGRWNGTTWDVLGGVGSSALAANGSINAICGDAAGNTYATGEFTNSSGRYYVAKFNGTTWSELGGTNSLNANGKINAMCIDANGNIYVAGNFTNSNGYRYVAKWNGTIWSQVGGALSSTFNGNISSMCLDASGKIFVAGANSASTYFVSEFNGFNWVNLSGLSNTNNTSTPPSISVDAAGILYFAGNFKDDIGGFKVLKYGNVSACQAQYTLVPDSMPQNWTIINQCSGVGYLNYSWDWGDGSINSTAANPKHVYTAPGHYNVCVSITDYLGCTSTYCDSIIYIDSVATNAIAINVVNQFEYVGIKKVETNHNSKTNILSICPNPASNTVTIKTSSPSMVNVQNYLGEVVISKYIQNQIIIDVSHLAKGLYIIKSTNGEFAKMIKE